MPPSPYAGDRVLIVDSSAWGVVHRAQERESPDPLVADFNGALRRGQLRGSTAVKLELLHHARNPDEFQAVERELDAIHTLPVTAQASSAAESALRDLSAESTPGNPMAHRVKNIDALIAGTAWHYSFDILHYDGHFDRLARVLGFNSVWIAPPGDY